MHDATNNRCKWNANNHSQGDEIILSNVVCKESTINAHKELSMILQVHDEVKIKKESFSSLFLKIKNILAPKAQFQA